MRTKNALIPTFPQAGTGKELVAPFHAPRRRCILLSMNGASIAIKQQ
jgi:hypothetical protein